MKHNWELIHQSGHPESPWGIVFVGQRRCMNCGKWQKRELISHSVTQGSKYLWRPLAGRCQPQLSPQGTDYEQIHPN